MFRTSFMPNEFRPFPRKTKERGGAVEFRTLPKSRSEAAGGVGGGEGIEDFNSFMGFIEMKLMRTSKDSSLGTFNVSNLMGIKRRWTDTGKK